MSGKWIKSSLFILILLFLTTHVRDLRAFQQEEDRLTFLIVGGKRGAIRRFENISNLQKLYLSKEKRRTAEKFLLAIARKPLSKEQILKQSHLSLEEFDDISSFLLSIKMIAPINNEWATTLPVIIDQEMSTLRENLSPLADKIASAVSGFIPQIKTVYDQNRLASDPELEKVAHLFISYFLMDTSFLRFLGTLENKKGFRQYYSEKQNILPAFFLEVGKNFTNFGCNSYSFDTGEKKRRIYVFVLHGTLFDRIKVLVNKYERNPDFSSALFKLLPQAGSPPLSENEKKICKALGWMEEDKLMVPVLNIGVRRHLTPILSKAAESAAEEVFKNFEVILDTFKKSPYSKFLDGAGDYIQYCYHILMYLTIEKLIRKGLLPAIPKPVPGYLGTYILYSSSK